MSINILHTEWSEGWGGQEKRVLLEVEGLQRRGVKGIIVTQPGSPLAIEAGKKGIEVVELTIKGALDIRAIYRIYRLIKDKRIDIVNTHSSCDSWVGFFASKMARSPALVRTRHLSVPISNSVFNFIYNVPDAIITTADVIRDMLISQNGIDPGRVFSIPTGVDLAVFNAAMNPDSTVLRKTLGIDRRRPIISTISVLRSWKGHRYFVEAASKVKERFPEAIFLIVGEGPQRTVIEELIRERGLGSSIVMTGYREDVPQLLRLTDIFVMTSVSYEGVPQALLQAMAMNVPVVATNVGGIGEIVKGLVTGILIEPHDVESLVNGILYLLKNPEKARDMALAGKDLVEKGYSLEIMIDKILKVYTNLLDKTKNKINGG